MSDTHLPKRAKRLPDRLWDDIERADLVVHAGDWVTVDLLDEMTERSARLVGVRGNNDGPEFASRLPEVAAFTVGALRFEVVHETGGRDGRERRMLDRHPDADVLVFGHSHIPWDSTATTAPGAARSLRLLNPGSPTDRRRQPEFTWMTADVHGTDIDVRLVRLDTEGRVRSASS